MCTPIVFDHSFEVVSSLFLVMLLFLGRQPFHHVQEVGVRLIGGSCSDTLVILEVNLVFFVLLIIAIILDEVFLPEVLCEIDLSIKPLPHDQILGIIHHILLVLLNDVEVISCVHLDVTHCSPVVTFYHVLHGLASLFFVIRQDSSFD